MLKPKTEWIFQASKKEKFKTHQKLVKQFQRMYQKSL